MEPVDEEKAVKISVSTEKDDSDKDDPVKDEPKIDETKNGKKNKPDDDTPTMSEEDQELKERLETCVSTLVNAENEDAVTIPIRLKALEVIVTELRTATASMTSVPKPLKFLRPHFTELKDFHTSLSEDVPVATDNDKILLRARVSDILSVLAMTMGNQGKDIRR
jgi:26S proteasome regulatory subunit N1